MKSYSTLFLVAVMLLSACSRQPTCTVVAGDVGFLVPAVWR